MLIAAADIIIGLNREGSDYKSATYELSDSQWFMILDWISKIKYCHYYVLIQIIAFIVVVNSHTIPAILKM